MNDECSNPNWEGYKNLSLSHGSFTASKTNFTAQCETFTLVRGGKPVAIYQNGDDPTKGTPHGRLVEVLP